ncbi:MAG: hypothetical protein KF774_17535 [Planctomyces sp.]|nr:hypothetical protein [Planctomyces sp.]
MSVRSLLPLVLGAGMLSGCIGSGMGRETTAWMRSLKPESWEEDNPADDPGDPWISAAGLEGRPDQERETVTDPLNLRPIFMSERARSIERNVGIGD